MATRLAQTLMVAVAAVALSACGPRPDRVIVHDTVEVRVPVYMRLQPPAELARQYVPGELPEFISPLDSGAAVALSSDGARGLRALLRDLMARDDAWRAWAIGDEPGTEAVPATGAGNTPAL